MFRDEERLLCTSTEIQSVRYEYLDDPRVVTHVNSFSDARGKPLFTKQKLKVDPAGGEITTATASDAAATPSGATTDLRFAFTNRFSCATPPNAATV